jgi:hypothetical protein
MENTKIFKADLECARRGDFRGTTRTVCYLTSLFFPILRLATRFRASSCRWFVFAMKLNTESLLPSPIICFCCRGPHLPRWRTGFFPFHLSLSCSLEEATRGRGKHQFRDFSEHKGIEKTAPYKFMQHSCSRLPPARMPRKRHRDNEPSFFWEAQKQQHTARRCLRTYLQRQRGKMETH